MGMPFTLAVRGDAAPGCFEQAFAELRMLDALFSPFRAESAVGRINAGTLDARSAGALVSEVSELCEHYAARTNGYFSAWASGRFDPTGLVKGWAIERVCAILERAGYRDYFVDGAGDVRTRGEREPGMPWRVGIRHPFARGMVTQVLEATDLAVATSGTYEKGVHILDPHTGRAAPDLMSFPVVGPNIVAADAYATAAFVMGMAGLAFIERLSGYEAYAIDPALRSRWTTGFAAHRAAA